jgi:predicted XRE-type DNA-binding protein
MLKCSCCKKEKEIENFIKGNKTLKNCKLCRDQNNQWKKDNAERVKEYNAMSSNNKINKREKITVVLASLKGKDEWIEFKNQAEAANKLGLQKPNINKVINNKLSQTGGYEFKVIEKDFEKLSVKSWEEIVQEKGFGNKVLGVPSKQRVLHTEKDNILGKVCCNCKEWRSLDDYNYCKDHWDNLRNHCKICLVKWRKENRESIQMGNTRYEKNRKQTDPEFKLMKTLRSRLGTAISQIKAEKSDSTLNLTGCTIKELKNYLEEQFTEGMTWDNHGDWHIDHIKPICAFDLSSEIYSHYGQKIISQKVESI